MSESKAIFENEEAIRLLNYFVTYKEFISRDHSSPDSVTFAVLKPEELTIK